MAANNLPSEMTKALHQDLMAIVAEENVILDEENRTLLSHDVFYRPDVIADSVVTPTSTQELAERMIASTSSIGTSLFSLMVRPWL